MQPRTIAISPDLTNRLRARTLLVVMVMTVVISVVGGLIASRTHALAAVPTVAVSGNHLVDGSGAPVRLLGVNRSGTEYACVQHFGTFDGPNDQASVSAIASWHVNAVRVPLNEDCWLGIEGMPNNGGTAAQYQQAIKDYVNLLNANGIYAILELHWTGQGPGKPATSQTDGPNDYASLPMWQGVAAAFKDNHSVLFDVFNEPAMSCSWTEWGKTGCTITKGPPGGTWSWHYPGMQAFVTAIRGAGAATQPIMLGGLYYANAVASPGNGTGQGPCCGWLANVPSDPSNSIVLSVHNYNFNWPCPLNVGTTGAAAVTCYTSGDENLASIAAAHPVVFGEIGEDNGNAQYIAPLMTWMDSMGFSYLAWTWDTWGCGGPVLISNYNGTPCQTFGSGYQAHLAALAGNPSPTTVISVVPNNGPGAGGTSVVITGTSFTGATAVKFGTAAATPFTVTSATQITATSPAGTGTVDVTVTSPSGTSPTSPLDQFTYQGPPPTVTSLAPTSGPAGGATSVVITGTNLNGATGVKFGATAATSFTVNSATQITATSPMGTGTVDVTVSTPSGTSATGAGDKFTYTAAPTVVLLVPNNGPTMGATSVVITGTGFTGATGVKFGSTAATNVVVTSATQITAISPAGTGTVDVTVTTLGGTSATSAADKFTYTLPPAAYTAVTPVRLLDTRNSGGPLGAGATRNLNVAGVTPGAPAGATAVVLNVTATNTTASSYLTVYPAGSARPLASSLNWVAGKTVPNLVTVPVGTGGAGAITLYNGVGSTDVVVDLEGYFAAPSGSAGGEVALTPSRITDTRAGSGKANAGSTLGVGSTLSIQVTGAGGVPASGVSAAILNVTVTNTSAPGALTVWPAGAGKPLASNLNWVAGQTVPNRVFVPVGTGGQVSIFNFAGSADVVVDVVGYFTDSTASGKLFTAVSPLRMVDTRLTGQTLGAGGSFTLPVGGSSGVPSGASAVILNVTATNTNAPSFLVAYPSTASLPTASDLNWTGGQTIANMVVGTLGSTGAITFYNGAGSSDVVADLAGWFS